MAPPFKNMLQRGRSSGGPTLARGRGTSPRTKPSGSQGAAHAEANLERGRAGFVPATGGGVHGGVKGHGPGADLGGMKSPGGRALTPPKSADRGQEKINQLGRH